MGADSHNGHVATRGQRKAVLAGERLLFAQRVAYGWVAAIIWLLCVMACYKGRTSLVLQHWRSRCMCPLLPRWCPQLEDLRQLVALTPLGVCGVLVGKALYESVSRQQACAAVQQE